MIKRIKKNKKQKNNICMIFLIVVIAVLLHLHVDIVSLLIKVFLQ